MIGAAYLNLLQDNIRSKIREQFEDEKEYYFQQDGKPSHYHSDLGDNLNESANGWIGLISTKVENVSGKSVIEESKYQSYFGYFWPKRNQDFSNEIDSMIRSPFRIRTLENPVFRKLPL
ncbi:hypothetical protein GQX74_013452 [Glossina fuscipes]|nr:hypothetical protein GQX74_013452 [Glossina fuscipes]